MEQSYPVALSLDENGSIIAEFPDVPEAMTMGGDENEALEWAQDALVVALTGYIEERRDVPKASAPESGQKRVHLPPHVAMKLAIYQAMRNKGLTQAALGKCLGVDGRQVRRILDLDHNSTMSQLVSALKCVGKELVIDIRDAA